MYNQNRSVRLWVILSLILILAPGLYAQKTKSKKGKANDKPVGHAVLWEQGDIKGRDLFNGPGGKSMKPDLTSVTFLSEDKSGHNKKYKIKDGSGREWVAKFGREARPETAAVRLLWGLGYKTEINYLVPSLTIPGKGTFSNVRLEARPDGIKRLDEWKWRDNPFLNSNELQGLKIMMVFMTNWDLLDMQNKILRIKNGDGAELDFVISDLGATFGRFGNNDIPIFYRLGRKTDDPKAWSKAPFIKGVKKGQLRMAYKGGKSRGIMNGITVDQGRWLADMLRRLSDDQIRDAFRAANYSDAEIDILTRAAKRRIDELDRATSQGNLAGK